MERTSSDSRANSEFTFDPTDKVVGVIDDAGDATAALSDCLGAGFKDVELLTNEEGARRVSGEGREVTVHVFHSTQRVPAFYDAPRYRQASQGRWRTLHQLLRALGGGGARTVILIAPDK